MSTIRLERLENPNTSDGGIDIDSSGKVGIGTTTPGSLLELSTDATSAAGGITVDNTNAAGYSTLQLKNSGASGKTYTVSVGGNTSGLANKFYIYDDTAAATRFVINSSGNVGIGTTSPSSKLHSVGTTILGTGTYPTGSIGLSGARTAILSSTENQILVVGNTNATVDVDKGAEIYLGAKATTGSENLAFAKVGGFRSTAISGNFASHLTFSTSNSVGTSSEKVRIDSGGRVLVGTTDTHSASHYYDDLVIQNDGSSTGAGITLLGNASYGYAGIVFADSVDAVNGGAIKYSNNQDYLWFETVGTERLRIGYNGKYEFNPAGAGMYIYNFTNNAGNSTVKYNYSSGLLSYDTSSRLVKENIVDCPYGIEEIKQLQPRKYVRLDGGEIEIGFIADEMHEVMPEFAPCGKKSILTKNEEDEEVIPLSVNYDKLTAVLTKALQEAIAKIETLEAKVAALESTT